VRFASVLTAPLWLPDRLEAIGGGETWFTTCSELLSLVAGPPGILLRRGFYLMTLQAFADNVSIGFGTTLAHRQVRIGQGVYIGNRCTLGMVTIEEHATIGSNVDILSGRRQHHFRDPDRPIQEQGGTLTRVRIGRNSWIGNSAVIMADIGVDCVIGAGAVVVNPIPGRSVAAGNPARIIRSAESAREPQSCGP
jgi:acetyltransferase-like isoleucine patch superfamily enzyme